MTRVPDQPVTSIETFDDARRAVAAGRPVSDVAAAFVAGLSEQERLWCLDGDAPTWVGLKFLSESGYHLAPFVAAEIDRVGLPGIRFSDGPRGCVVGNATAFPVSMARGATWDPQLEERVKHCRQEPRLLRVFDGLGREVRLHDDGWVQRREVNLVHVLIDPR